MHHLFKDWSKIKNKIKNSRFTLLLLDYDGTLTPIAPTPKDAVLELNQKRLLLSLTNKANMAVGLISGRSLKDIKKIVGLKGIYYAGNHGLEIAGPGIKFRYPSYLYFSTYIKKIAHALRENTKSIEGVIIEDKGLSLSLHYRLVNKARLKEIKDIFKRVCLSYLKSKKIKITQGKKVLEVRPPFLWDKGKAFKLIEQIVLSEIKNQTTVLRIYIGDDKTDEDVFKILTTADISILVGRPAKTKARYFLNNTSEAGEFLHRVNNIIR